MNPTPCDISLIVAIGRNRVMGRDNQMPWHMPADLQYFKKVTLGAPMIMGRRTFESIGRLLPGRVSIIVSRQPDYRVDGALVAPSLEAALAAAAPAERIFVIGGGDLFRQALPLAQRAYVTEIQMSTDGDTYFPALPPSDWKEVSRERHQADPQNPFDYHFVIYERQ